MREAQRHEARTLADQRRALQHAREELQRTLPERAAGRIQAQARAIRARIDFGRLRIDAADEHHRETEAAGEERRLASRARLERSELRAQEAAAVRLQGAMRVRRSRQTAEEKRAELAREQEVWRREQRQLRADVHAKLRAKEEDAAAATLQAVARRRRVRAMPPTQARQARRAHRAKVERQLEEDRAARSIQRIARGRRGRNRTRSPPRTRRCA